MGNRYSVTVERHEICYLGEHLGRGRLGRARGAWLGAVKP